MKKLNGEALKTLFSILIFLLLSLSCKAQFKDFATAIKAVAENEKTYELTERSIALVEYKTYEEKNLQVLRDSVKSERIRIRLNRLKLKSLRSKQKLEQKLKKLK